MSCISWYGSA
jgi:hypothetical protein